MNTFQFWWHAGGEHCTYTLNSFSVELIFFYSIGKGTLELFQMYFRIKQISKYVGFVGGQSSQWQKGHLSKE